MNTASRIVTEKQEVSSLQLAALTEREELIANIILLAIENSNSSSFEKFDRSTQRGRTKIVAWNLVLEKIPPDYLLPLYKYTEQNKQTNGMVSPKDMLRFYKSGQFRRVEHANVETEKILDDPATYRIVEGTVNLEKQCAIRSRIKTDFHDWEDFYPQPIAGDYGYIMKDYCGCGINKLPIAFWTKGRVVKCNWCLAELLEIVT